MKILTVSWFLLLSFHFQIITASEDLRLRHDPVSCAVPGVPLNVLFTIESTTLINEARIYFKARNARNFYYIQAVPQNDGRYGAIVPGPMSAVKRLEYRILVVDAKDHAFTSPIFQVNVKPQSECPQAQSQYLRTPVVVSAENEFQPGIGFSGISITWRLAQEQSEKAYLNQAREVSVQPDSHQTTSSSKFKNLLVGKKTMLGIGAGLGSAALIGIIAGGDDNTEKNIWDSVDDITENVSAELIKTPDIQTSCGTVVTNQLYVTNNGAEELMIGTIDYEIILTRDKPAGSCELGRTGAFAPNLETVIPPNGQPLLVREWSNEVNSCSGCPYVLAECQWESRYIVNTSAGSAVTLTQFISEGDLCGTSTTKSHERSHRIKGDLEP